MNYGLHRYSRYSTNEEYIEYLTDYKDKVWIRFVVRYITPDNFEFQFRPKTRWHIDKMHKANRFRKRDKSFVKDLTEKEAFIELL